MQIKRRAITVGTTFFLAAATGHVMQNGDTISARLRGAEAPEKPVLASVETTAAVIEVTPAAVPTSVAEPVPAPVVPDSIADVSATRSVPGLPDLPAAEPKPFTSGVLLAARMDRIDDAYVRPKTAADVNYSIFGIACTEGSMTIEPTARAMLRVSLSAPCLPNERVVISHSGLTFAMTTDKAGDLDVMVPALAAAARVDARFGSGDVMSATRAVTGLDALSRVAVQWEGAEGFHLNAFENGAGFGAPGHVSAEQPRDRATSEGGFLTVLGDPTVDHPLMAEVYTAPVATQVDDIEIEAAVTEATCGRTLGGEALRMASGAATVSDVLTFAMPGCDAVGDFLMLSLAPVAATPVAMAQSGK